LAEREKQTMTNVPKTPPRDIASAQIFVPMFALTVCLMISNLASAQTETILHSFITETPSSSLIMDSQGNLYGTTYNSGEPNRGTVFALSPPAESGDAWTEKTLHVFQGIPDGEYPGGNLVMDSEGNLYGTASGGSQGGGVIFEVTAAGEEKIIYNFKLNKIDGHSPIGLLRDSHGNFYGTTFNGGATNNGTVYELTAAGQEKVLYSFNGFPDGYNPVGAPVMDSQGNLYGTTFKGGPKYAGTVFQVTPAGVETILHGFQANSKDGQYPYAGLVTDSLGNLYGTTGYGGVTGSGTIFEITAAGAEKILYSFKGGSRDGQLPQTGLIFDSLGNLYGTTAYDPNFIGPFGTVFELTPAGKEIILHKFTGTPDGDNPAGNVLRDSFGNIYGTTSIGGAYGSGTVFEIVP
jgi:uncharacterized repeat protein (TIGR03803 family)